MLKPEIIHFGKMSLVSRCYEICAIKYSENKVIMQSGLSETWNTQVQRVKTNCSQLSSFRRF